MRISGITIPDKKRLEIALTVVHGVGYSTAKKILNDEKISLSSKTTDLTPEQEASIRKKIEVLQIEGDLRRDISSNIKRLKDISCYRGSRHIKRLPSRGQRTKTNARTLKGAKKTMGSGRVKLQKK